MKKLLFLWLLCSTGLVYGMQNPSDQANSFLDRNNLSFQLGSIKNEAAASITVFDEWNEPLRHINDKEIVVFNRRLTEFEQFERTEHGVVRFSTIPLRLLVESSDSDSSEEEANEIYLQLIGTVQDAICRAEILLLKELEDGAMNTLRRLPQRIKLPLRCPYTAMIDVVIEEHFDFSRFEWTFRTLGLEGQR